MELVRRAGGPTLHVSTRLLYVALRISAYDKRITDESWRLLEVVRKELLLPLVDVTALREAARHVDLTHKVVQGYVNGQLAEQGDTRAVRWTTPQMQKQLEKLRTMLAERAPVRRLRELRSSLSDEERDGLLSPCKGATKGAGGGHARAPEVASPPGPLLIKTRLEREPNSRKVNILTAP
jgi:hypothetical protein